MTTRRELRLWLSRNGSRVVGASSWLFPATGTDEVDAAAAEGLLTRGSAATSTTSRCEHYEGLWHVKCDDADAGNPIPVRVREHRLFAAQDLTQGEVETALTRMCLVLQGVFAAASPHLVATIALVLHNHPRFPQLRVPRSVVADGAAAPFATILDAAAAQRDNAGHPTVRSALRDVARGLAALHAHDVAHGDVRLENVVALSGAEYTVTCALANVVLCCDDEPSGRLLEHVPPEALHGPVVNAPGDMWALGVLALVLLRALGVTTSQTGELDASSDESPRKTATARVQRLRDEVAALGNASYDAKRIAAVVLACLTVDASARPTAAQMVAHLEGYLCDACAARMERVRSHDEALLACVAEGHADCAATIIGGGVSPNASRDGTTALMVAAVHGHVNCVHALARSGAALNAATPAGRLAVMEAAHAGRDGAVAALLELNAAYTAVDRKGWSALVLAAAGGHTKCVEVLLARAQSDRCVNARQLQAAVTVAAHAGHADVIRRLLREVPAAAFAAPSRGRPTVLMLATTSGCADAVAALLAHGLPPNERSEDGATALHLAARRGLVPCVDLLVQHGADVNVPDARGATPLMLAAAGGFTGCVAALLAAGADAAARQPTASALTAADHAAAAGHGALAATLQAAAARPC